MFKLAKRLALAFFILVLAASLAILCLLANDAEAQAVAPHKWVVTFTFKQKPANEIPDPDMRIYVVVTTATEGQAAINAHKALAEKLTTNAVERLEFLEAARKD